MGDGNGTSSWIEFAMTPRCYEEMYMSMNYADGKAHDRVSFEDMLLLVKD